MHAALKISLLIVLGMMLGAIVAIPALVLFLRTDAGGYMLRTYVMALPQWPDVNTNNIALSTPAATSTVQSAATSTNIAVPKVYVTAQYHTALNALAQSAKDFGTSYATLVPLLTTINANSLSHNYTGFFDLIVQAKTQVASEQTIVSDMATHLHELSVANMQTTDAQTKSMTNDVISSAQRYHDELVVYVGALNNLLSGSAPTVQQLIDINSQANTVKDAAQAFDAKAQSLFVYFASSVQASQASSGASH